MGPRTGQRVVAASIGFLLPAVLALEAGGYGLLTRHQLALTIWWGIAIAFLLGLLPVAKPAPALRLPLAALGALVAWTAISLVWTESVERTLEELARTLGYGGLVILVVSGVNRDTWRAAASGICLAVVGITVLAVVSRLMPGAFPEVNTGVLDGERLRYPLHYWNAVACWAAMALAVGLAWSCASRQAWLRSLSLATVPVAGIAIYLTYSRGGALVAAIAVIVVVALSRERWNAAIHAALGLLGTTIVVLVVRANPEIADGTGGDGGALVAAALLLAGVACAVGARLTRVGRDEQRAIGRRIGIAAVASGVLALGAGTMLVATGPGADSPTGSSPESSADPAARFLSIESPRRELWGATLSAWRSAPSNGIGPGTFEYFWARSGRRVELVRDAHSLYFEFLAELGLPGLIFLGAFLIGLARAATQAAIGTRRARDRAAAVACVAILVVFLAHAGLDWMWELTAVGAVALLAGTIAATARSSPRRRSHRLAAWRLGLVVFATAAGIVQIPGLISTDRLRESGRWFALGFEEQARESADDAISAAPWSASAYAARAHSALLSGEAAAARADALAAIEREPTNWRHRLLLVQVEEAAGDEDAEERARQELVRLRPKGFDL